MILVKENLNLGVSIKELRSSRNKEGKYESSIAKITPVNLNRIWGRRLGLKNCAVIEFKMPGG